MHVYLCMQSIENVQNFKFECTKLNVYIQQYDVQKYPFKNTNSINLKLTKSQIVRRLWWNLKNEIKQ